MIAFSSPNIPPEILASLLNLVICLKLHNHLLHRLDWFLDRKALVLETLLIQVGRFMRLG